MNTFNFPPYGLLLPRRSVIFARAFLATWVLTIVGGAVCGAAVMPPLFFYGAPIGAILGLMLGFPLGLGMAAAMASSGAPPPDPTRFMNQMRVVGGLIGFLVTFTFTGLVGGPDFGAIGLLDLALVWWLSAFIVTGVLCGRKLALVHLRTFGIHRYKSQQMFGPAQEWPSARP